MEIKPFGFYYSLFPSRYISCLFNLNLSLSKRKLSKASQILSVITLLLNLKNFITQDASSVYRTGSISVIKQDSCK